MKHSRFISSTPLMAGLLTGLMFAILAVPLNAADSHSRYDVSKEVTLSGTVSSVLYKPAPGMIWGSHLMVETAFGRLDASLGHSVWRAKTRSPLPPASRLKSRAS